MPELLFLGSEIFFGVRTGSDFAGNAFNDVNSGAFKGLDLFRIVRQQTHTRDPQRFENLGWEREIAVVVLETEMFVGLNRVESGILQFVGLQLGHQSDATAFL